MIDSIVEYYNTHNTPISNVQKNAITMMMSVLGVEIEPSNLDDMTRGEAIDIIRRLNKVRKDRQ